MVFQYNRLVGSSGTEHAVKFDFQYSQEYFLVQLHPKRTMGFTYRKKINDSFSEIQRNRPPEFSLTTLARPPPRPEQSASSTS